MRTKDWTIANGETVYLWELKPQRASRFRSLSAEVKGLVGFTEFKGRERGYFRMVWLKNSHKYLIRKVLSRLNN